MEISKFNITLNNGFQKENDSMVGMSYHAKSILTDLLSLTQGDLSKTAKLLDKILEETQMKMKELTEEENVTDAEFYERLSKLRSHHKDTLNIIEQLYLSPANNLYKAESKDRDNSHDKTMSTTNVRRDYLDALGKSGTIFNKADTNTHIGSTISVHKNTFNSQENFRGPHWSNCSGEKKMEPNNKEMVVAKSSEWRHHITIPKPFNLTTREDLKKKAGYLSRSMGKLHEEECCKPEQFRASPISAHVKLARYEQTKEENVRQWEAGRTSRQEFAKKTEELFSSTSRENERSRNILARSQSAKINHKTRSPSTCSSTWRCDGNNELNKKEHFNHFAYPKSKAKAEEDQLLRDVKRHLRAERLLQSASLPPGMEERQIRSQLRRAERMARTRERGFSNGIDQKTSFKARPAPNFKKVHWEAQKALRRIWQPPPEPTCPEPFRLRTSQRCKTSPTEQDLTPYPERAVSSARERNSLLIQKSKSPDYGGTHSSYDMPLPPKAHATMLRESFIRQSIEKSKQQAEKEKEEKLANQAKQRELSKAICQTCGDRVLPPQSVISAMTDERKRNLVQQEAEYKRELEEMRKRVATKPLLITRQSQELARKRAEEKFKSALQRAGIDPEELMRKPIDRHTSGFSDHDQTDEQPKSISAGLLFDGYRFTEVAS